MANTLANLARVASSTTGTGTLTLGAAATGCLTFADAGVANGAVVTYAIEDYDGSGNIIAREIGAGTYSTTGPTLSRDTVYSSTNAGSQINCSGLQHVFVTASKEDFASLLTSAAAAAAYQPLDADLTTLATNITAFGHDLVDSASASAARSTLGLGTMATETASNYLTTSAAASGYQPLDSELTAIAGLTSAADRLPYFTGPGTASLATFTTAGRALVDDADAAAQRTTLGLGTAAVANTGTSGNALPFLDATNNWSGGQIITLSNSNAVPMQFISTNADANAGPYLYLYRNSASPAANDIIGTISIRGNDSAANLTNYCEMDVLIDDTTDGSEDATFRITMPVAGSSAARFKFANGLQIGFPTGGFMGNGTVNAATLYEHGTSLAAKYGALASANTFTAAQTISVDSAATNIVTTVATVRSTSTGTPAAGIGVALDFAAETAAGNNEIGGRISAVTTDVTSASEDFDLVFSAMAAGAAVAEVGRMTSKGTYKYPSFTVAGLPAGTAGETAFASNGRKNGEGAGLGTGVLVFHDGTAWRACDTGATVAA